MLYLTHNYLAAIRIPLRHLGIRPSMQPTVAWQVGLALVAVLLATAACGDDPSTASASDPAILFPQQSPANNERVVMEADLIGELVVAGGCLRVNESNTGLSFLLVWPPDFTLSTENDTIQVLNGADQVVACVGDEIYVSGGEVRLVEFPDEQVRQKLPADCPGPYWIVGDEVSLVETTEESKVPSVAPSVEVSTPALLNDEEALVQDAKVYASDQGISLDEALRRLKLQDVAGDLGAELAVKERDTFAGLWIQRTPQFRIVVQFTHDGEETIRPYVENGPLADIVEVRTASVTLKELEATQSAALLAIRDLHIPVDSGINVFENRVELYVVEPARFDAVLREANVQLPDDVVVITVGELSMPD